MTERVRLRDDRVVPVAVPAQATRDDTAPAADGGTAPRGQARSRRDRLERLAPTLIPAVLMALIGSYRIGSPALSWDEVATADVAQRSWSQLWHLSQNLDASLCPYYAVMHVWTTIFGISELALRVPSLVAMVVAAALTGELARRLFGGRTALVAGTLFCLIPHTARYAQEARPYAFACALAVAAALLLLSALQRPGAAAFARYGLAVVLLGAAHLVALTVLGGHAVLVILHWQRTRRHRTAVLWLATTGAALLALAPLALLGSSQLQSQISWIPPMAVGNLRSAPAAIVGSATGAWLLLGLALLAIGRARSAVIATAALAVVPVAAVAAVSFVGQSMWTPRYMLIALPPLAILAAAGVTGAAGFTRGAGPLDRTAGGGLGGSGLGRVGRVALVVLVLCWATVPDQRRMRGPEARNGGNYRMAAETIIQRQQPGDVVLYQRVQRQSRSGIDYYLRDDPGRPVDFLQTRSAAEVGTLKAAEDGRATLRLQGRQRVWYFVFGRPSSPLSLRPDLGPTLRSRFRVVDTWLMETSTLVLYERIPGS